MHRNSHHLQVTLDEEVSKVDFAKLPSLKSAFQKDGNITASDASNLHDCAADLIMKAAARAAALGLNPLAHIRSVHVLKWANCLLSYNFQHGYK